MNTRTG
jgi:hypothetical protein